MYEYRVKFTEYAILIYSSQKWKKKKINSMQKVGEKAIVLSYHIRNVFAVRWVV